MADFQNDYQDSTNTINSIIETQLSQVPKWSNIPGSLIKASSSSAGYVWGYNNDNNLYRCPLPCTGKWELVSMSSFDLQGIHDIATDNTNIYVLARGNDSKTYMLSTNATSTTGWIKIKVPFDAHFIYSTHTYIWVQDINNKKYKCAKPCTTGGWVEVRDKGDVKITSSSDTTLYGVTKEGKAMRNEETMRSEWQPIEGISKYNVSAVIGQLDSSALYGVDEQSNFFRCDGDCKQNKVERVDLDGFVPVNISPDVGSQDLWLTTQTVDNKGNIYNKLDRPDYSGIMNKLNPLDKRRDDVIKEVESEYNLQTNVMEANKQVSDFASFFKKMFPWAKDEPTKVKGNIGELEKQIRQSQIQIDQFTYAYPFLMYGLILVIIIMLIYILLSGLLGTWVHLVSLLVSVGGILYMVYFLPPGKNNGEIESNAVM